MQYWYVSLVWWLNSSFVPIILPQCIFDPSQCHQAEEQLCIKAPAVHDDVSWQQLEDWRRTTLILYRAEALAYINPFWIGAKSHPKLFTGKLYKDVICCDSMSVYIGSKKGSQEISSGSRWGTHSAWDLGNWAQELAKTFTPCRAGVRCGLCHTIGHHRPS